MPNDRPVPRVLQQQPRRESDPQQQRAGATDFQPRGQMEGGGGHTAGRDHYQTNPRDCSDRAEMQADGDAARPRSESDARELLGTERGARSHSKAER